MEKSGSMIRVTKLNGVEVVVNAGAIETLEATPDTLVRLVNGRRLAVRETVDEVIEKVIAYQREVHQGPLQARAEDAVQGSALRGGLEES